MPSNLIRLELASLFSLTPNILSTIGFQPQAPVVSMVTKNRMGVIL